MRDWHAPQFMIAALSALTVCFLIFALIYTPMHMSQLIDTNPARIKARSDSTLAQLRACAQITDPARAEDCILRTPAP